MGKIISLRGLDDKDVDNNVKIIALTAKCMGWEIGFRGEEDGPFTGFILGEKEFVGAILKKLNTFDYLFKEEK